MRADVPGRYVRAHRVALPVAPPGLAEPGNMPALVRVFVIVDERSSPSHPLGDAVETFIRREDAELFVEEVRGDDPELAATCGSRSGSWRRVSGTEVPPKSQGPFLREPSTAFDRTARL
jgi:hypothetical protein